MNIEILDQDKKLSIDQCESIAKDMSGTVLFDLCGPSGSKEAKWLDPYFGLFQIIGEEGFLRASQFRFADVWCENVRVSEESS